MKKEVFDQLKKEFAIIGVMFVVLLVAFKIIFLSESFFVVFRTLVAIFWLIFIPGFMIMFYWNDKLKFYERFIIGIGVGTAVIGLLSYYLGIIGFSIKFHVILLPLILILFGFFISFRKK